jgi:hypothetical protein
MLDYEDFVLWDNSAGRYAFAKEFTGAQNPRLPIEIFGCFADANVSSANIEYEYDGELLSPCHSLVLEGVISSTNASPTGLSEGEIMIQSDFSDDYFRLGLLLSDGKVSSLETVQRILDHAKTLGENLVLATA